MAQVWDHAGWEKAILFFSLIVREQSTAGHKVLVLVFLGEKKEDRKCSYAQRSIAGLVL